MMRVLGLDLSITATGVAAGDGELMTLRHKVEGDRRLLNIEACIETVAIDVTFAAIEDLPTHAHGAGITGMVHGVTRLALLKAEVPYLLVPPSSLKVYATGNGRCQKADMRVELLTRTGVDVPDDNQCDAEWLRLLGLDLAGHPELKLPKTHRRALAKLTLPPEVANVG